MRRVERSSLATLGALALILGAPGAGSAAAPVSQSFTTSGEQQWVVPPGVSGVQVTAVGGNGGPGNGGIPGGSGGTVTAALTVSPGETLYAEVAGNGQGTNTNAHEEGRGGYGGGGGGGERVIIFVSAPAGGGGGGASDVRTCPASATPAECGGRSSLASRLLVAAGGGGGGGVGLPFSDAGNGGPADLPGYAGSNDSQGDEGGSGGTRGAQSAGGKGGSPSFGCSAPPEGPGCAISGQLGLGGEGGTAQGGGGGGGGGGLFGGGGGGGGWGSATGSGASLTLFNAGGGGGGGGASGVPTGATGVSAFSLVPTAEGAQPSVTFTWTPSAPASVTGAPSSVTPTTAALDGTVNPSDWLVSNCTFSLSPAPAGVATFPCAQQLGAGSTPLPVSATAAGLTPSTTYTVTLLATSVQGTGSGSPVRFTTPAPGATLAGSGPSSARGAGSGPTIGALKINPTRFHRGRHAAVLASIHRSKRKATGTTISFRLSTAASVTLDFQRAVAGQLAGHSCVRPSSKRRRAHRCTRYTPVSAAIALAAPAGTDRIYFEGAFGGGSLLGLGTYRLVLTASDAAGRTKAPQHPTFTVLT
jgi:hypothetical protein